MLGSGERSSARVLFTGDRPNGPMHLGHYVGSIRNRLACQGQGEQYIMIADHLALTDNIDDPGSIARNVVEVGLDYLATGIDPRLSTPFIQSTVLELAALTTLYMNLVSASYILENPTKNEEVSRRGFGDDAPAGMFTYSVSQVADITAFDADSVPVGTDQVPLVEFSAHLVRAFNERFGPVIVVPRAVVPPMGRLPGTDGRPKMGKSLGNAIYLSDAPDTVREKILGMATRLTGTPDGEFDPAVSPPFLYLREFHPDSAEVDALEERYRSGVLSDDALRRAVLDAVETFLGPVRDRRRAYADDPAQVMAMLHEGGDRARAKAAATYDRVKAAMGLRYP
ncbi:tryptophan--tRNA ligase [Streptomyces sp. NPDC048106]|uniref:tryptophan--tRNA ligase n=1 Tax=Streptomyces sp. NPDC048106 TaxID=3155750 RepID=UPI0034546BFC